jgi:drug/metabolite transporter (DMT)-like permease
MATPVLPRAHGHAPALASGIRNGVGAGALWGLVFLAPQLLATFSPLQQAVARYLAYGVLALALLLPRWKAATAQLGRREWKALLRLSLLGNLLYFVLLASAIQHAGGAATALIVGLVPVVVTVAGAGGPGGPGLRRLAGPCILAVLGTALIALDTVHAGRGMGGQAGDRWLGLACAGGALASWSAYSISNARWLQRHPDISGHDWSLLTGVATGALALLAAGPAVALDAMAHPALDWACFWAVSAGLALFASVLGNACWNRASRLLPLSLAGQMIVFETIFALLYGFAWEWRLPAGLELLAIACLLAGVLWCARLHAARAATPA